MQVAGGRSWKTQSVGCQSCLRVGKAWGDTGHSLKLSSSLTHRVGPAPITGFIDASHVGFQLQMSPT